MLRLEPAHFIVLVWIFIGGIAACILVAGLISRTR